MIAQWLTLALLAVSAGTPQFLSTCNGHRQVATVSRDTDRPVQREDELKWLSGIDEETKAIVRKFLAYRRGDGPWPGMGWLKCGPPMSWNESAAGTEGV